MDQGCRQGEATLHSARRVPEKAGPGVVEFDQLELFLISRVAPSTAPRRGKR